MLMFLVYVWSIFDIVQILQASEIALLPSFGCYSHDVMMREVGTEFSDDNITWVQLQAYDFGFTKNHLHKRWNNIIFKNFDDEAQLMQNYGHELLWETTLPVDYDRLWDLRGMYFFFNILRRNHDTCKDLIYSGNFKKLAESKKFDLVVIDHHLQECLVVLASFLNTTVVEFSNWPITDGYVSAMNVPSPPSYVPRTTTYFSGVFMTFVERVRNTFVDILFIFARIMQCLVVWNFFDSIEQPNVNLMDVEAEHLFYAGRSELLTEVIRPLNNRIRHFGCAKCGHPSDYYIKKPQYYIDSKNYTNEKIVDLSTFVLSENRTCHKKICSRDTLVDHMANFSYTDQKLALQSVGKHELYKNLNISELENRYVQVQMDYPEINFDQLEETKFILVSFGSVAKVEFMPEKLLDLFLDAFSRSNYLVLWATNGDISHLLKNKTLPSNLQVVKWAPIKILLAHRNLQYVIVHGGINTINELMLFGVPILGIPLQGDQPSNLQRLVELGLGEMLDIKAVWREELPRKMTLLELNYEMYRMRAQKISRMVNHHRDFTKNSQKFWLHWSTRHGNKIRNRRQRFFEFKYRGFMEYFAVNELVIYGAMISLTIYVIAK